MTEKKIESVYSDKACDIAKTVEEKISVPDVEKEVPISLKQATWLSGLILKTKAKKTLEIGMGWGKSAAVFLASEVQSHTVVEFEETVRSMTGNRNAKLFDRDESLSVIWQRSDWALPNIPYGENGFDIILIDGGHKFDDVFIDFHYASRLIAENGYIILDDIWMDSIKSVCSWIDENLSDTFVKIDLSDHDVDNFQVYQKNDISDKREWTHFVPFKTEWK